MNKYFFILFLFFNISPAQNDSLFNKSINDTVIIKTKDSASVKIISYPNISPVERYQGIIGAFLGAFFAGLIALFSIYFSAHFTKKHKHEREKNIYRELLKAAKCELEYHKQMIPIIIEVLEKIRDTSIQQGEIITTKSNRNISLYFLKEIRHKLIDLEILGTNILHSLTYYLNKCEIINIDLDFDSLVKLNEKYKGKINFQGLTKDYFNTEIDEAKNVMKAIAEIINRIDTELISVSSK